MTPSATPENYTTLTDVTYDEARSFEEGRCVHPDEVVVFY